MCMLFPVEKARKGNNAMNWTRVEHGFIWMFKSLPCLGTL